MPPISEAIRGSGGVEWSNALSKENEVSSLRGPAQLADLQGALCAPPITSQHTDKQGLAPPPFYVAWWDCHGMYHGVTDYCRNLACLKIAHLSVLSARYDNQKDETTVNISKKPRSSWGDCACEQTCTFQICGFFNSTIFNVPRLFIELRYNLVSPHPHVQPVPRAEPAMQQPRYNLVYDSDQMGIRYLCILHISNLVRWYYIRSSWASPFALNVIFLPLIIIYRNTTCLSQNDCHERVADCIDYRGSVCICKNLLDNDDRRRSMMSSGIFPHTRQIR